uniref:Uncharacterized protein n=1 Tax=Glossina brevipalpis TaxID=37001 RepID=A0A1A9W797_9MUSC
MSNSENFHLGNFVNSVNIKHEWYVRAIMATTVLLSACVIIAPGDVRPGHIILAPLKTKRIAPLSTCCIGTKYGNLCKSLSVGIQTLSRCRKKTCSPAPFNNNSM